MLQNQFLNISIAVVAQTVCSYFNVPYEKLLEKTRKRPIVEARQISMFLAKSFTKNSLKTIGEHFGGRDHTTVIHSLNTVKDLMQFDTNYKDTVIELEQIVRLYSSDPQKCFDLVSSFPHDVSTQDKNAEAEIEVLKTP